MIVPPAYRATTLAGEADLYRRAGLLDAYLEVHSLGLIRLAGDGFACETRGASPVVAEWLRQHSGEAASLIDAWLLARYYGEGPKVFRPTWRQYLALEQIAPQLTLADYAQPFPVMAVELPEEVRLRRRADHLGGPFVAYIGRTLRRRVRRGIRLAAQVRRVRATGS